MHHRSGFFVFYKGMETLYNTTQLRCLAGALLLLFVDALPIVAQGLALDRRSDWQKAGLAEPAPALLKGLNALDFGAWPDDAIGDASAIQSALDALDGKPGMVFLPAGTYQLNQPLDVPSGAVLRGAGADSTHLVVDFGGADLDAIRMGSAIQGPDLLLSQVPVKGTQTVRLAGTTAVAAGLKVGDWVEIVQDNGAWDEAPAGWAAESIGHLSRIRALGADSLLLDDAFRISFTPADNPRLRWVSPVSACGLECLSLTRSDSNGNGAMIWFYLAVNSWVRGVESFRSAGAHVLAARSAHLEISGNYFHEAWAYDGVKTHGYGVTLVRHTVATLVQDNVFRRLRHAMMVKQGANGNVFAYNYSTDPRRSEPVADYSGDISLHGHYPFANLFEGNTVQNIFTDNYWGPSGPGNAFYRNRVERYGIVMTSPNTNQQNYAGNDLTGSGPFFGFMLLSGTGNFSSGNYVGGMAEPPGTPLSGSLSWYLQAAPTWWDGPDAWPVSGFGAAGNLPAQVRFQEARAAVCRSARCAAPQGMQTDSVGSSFVALSWTAVPGAVSYGWRGREAAGGPWRYRNILLPMVELASGLDPGTLYSWQLRARCLNGYAASNTPAGKHREGPPSAWSTFAIPAEAPELGAKTASQSATLVVYPNPVSRSGSVWVETPAFWTFTDAQGRLVQTGIGSAQLSFGQLAPGIYRISDGQSSQSLLVE